MDQNSEHLCHSLEETECVLLFLQAPEKGVSLDTLTASHRFRGKWQTCSRDSGRDPGPGPQRGQGLGCVLLVDCRAQLQGLRVGDT